jgi:RimJ/RimL family protein N-acetyltransferase
MIIETERLILREIDPERDFQSWEESMADENTVRYLGSNPMDRAQAWRSMAMMIGHWSIRGFGFFSIESKLTGEWVGRVGPWFPEGWPAPEVGWVIAPGHLRKGYAFEAARASIDYAFNTLGWSRVIHVIMEGNEASIALAKKLGSSFVRAEQGLQGVTDKKVVIYAQNVPG